MDKILKDPIAPKEKKDGFWPWSFKAPTKDQAHSGHQSAGNYYGVGHRTPTGKDKAGSIQSGPIPQEARCFPLSEIFDGEDQKG